MENVPQAGNIHKSLLGNRKAESLKKEMGKINPLASERWAKKMLVNCPNDREVPDRKKAELNYRDAWFWMITGYCEVSPIFLGPPHNQIRSTIGFDGLPRIRGDVEIWFVLSQTLNASYQILHAF